MLRTEQDLRAHIRSGHSMSGKQMDALREFKAHADLEVLFAERIGTAVEDLFLDFVDHADYSVSQELRRRIRHLAGDFCAVTTSAIKDESREVRDGSIPA